MSEVIYLHDQSLARFGGIAGIRDGDLIESAMGAAINTFHYTGDDLFGIAAAYAFHLAESQAFLDGNKRTGAAAAITFLRLNGLRFPEDDGSLYDAMIAIANKRMDKTGLADVLRQLASAK